MQGRCRKTQGVCCENDADWYYGCMVATVDAGIVRLRGLCLCQAGNILIVGSLRSLEDTLS